ncbi:MAG: ABC transporter ATP-binding protein/permease [Pseudomonadota bacterium]|nr:ABC transporter ATP-binding protein/permease [Pseudomonadota bacterium]
MLDMLKALFHTLSPTQRRRFVGLQVLVVMRSFAEIASVTAIGPFTMLVSKMDALEGDGWLAQAYRMSPADSPGEFLVLLGGVALLALLLASFLSIYTTYALFRYSHNVGADISIRLFDHYMHQPWLYHASHNSSLLTKKIAVEAMRINKGILAPLMQMNSSLVLAAVLSLSLCLVEPVITLVGVSLFSLAYLAAYGTVRRKIARNGKDVSRQNAQQFRLMSEGFGGIREILLRSSQRAFVSRFAATAKALSSAQARNSSLAQTPRYIIELAALSAVIFAVVYLVRVHDGDVTKIVPLISIYGLATFKLLPAFQKVYSSLATMKGAQAAFISLREDLQASTPAYPRDPAEDASGSGGGSIGEAIVLDGIDFSYPGSGMNTLDKLSMKVPAGTVTGLVGASGAGKSTLIDILLGLVEPDRGRVVVDGVVLDKVRQRQWRKSVGFVPQAIYLADASIAENVAFGIPAAEIDLARVKQAVRTACLEDLITTLPDGLQSQVGERGVQLSGGQRQRIGIARALYHDPAVLILDEATNALDVLTERRIMDAVENASKDRTTLIVAHRLKTLKSCDTIFFMQGGKIVAEGTYDELLGSNEAFRQLDLLS